MELMRRLIAGIRRRGVLGTADRLVSIVQERIFDWRYGTDTVSVLSPHELPGDADPSPGTQRYEATRLRPFRQVMARLRPSREDVFVDFGCGKGRVLLAAASFGFKRVEGVEYAEELCAIARKNIAAFARAHLRSKGRRRLQTEFRVVHQDAGEYDVADDANYFYFFNPFGEQVMRSALDNIVRSLERRPRKATLVYCNPCWRRSIEETGVFRALGEYVFGEFVVYTNRAADDARPGKR